MPHDVVLLLNHILDTNVHASSIKEWTASHPVLSHVCKLVQTGWISEETSPALQPYFQCYFELSVIDGCLLRGSRVVIPPQGHPSLLSQLRDTHPGISRMKNFTQAYVWWPSLDKDMKDKVKQCVTCQISCPTPQQAPVHPWECPSSPRTRIHIVSSTSAEATIQVLRKLFATHGLPEQ
uniref:Integrase zinc-binding domain-containing protein n=1 Tax=Amphimedon queenslandica TaxID=400682 RepID=A0A1X7U996_AMPQE